MLTLNKYIYTHAGAEFELLGIMDEKTFLVVNKELYVLPTSRNRWHTRLLHTFKYDRVQDSQRNKSSESLD